MLNTIIEIFWLALFLKLLLVTGIAKLLFYLAAFVAFYCVVDHVLLCFLIWRGYWPQDHRGNDEILPGTRALMCLTLPST